MVTKIEWTEETINPVVGCTKVSPGCANCYAEKMAYRLSAMGVPWYDMVQEEGRWNGNVELVSEALDKPLHWKKPRKIFVCSMGDLFHEGVPRHFIHCVFVKMSQCVRRGHIFQVLTKRPERMAAFIEDEIAKGRAECDYVEWPLSNVWLGVTTENQEMADKRIPTLLQIPAAVRFVSVEPMLGPVDLDEHLYSFAWARIPGGAFPGKPGVTIESNDKLDWVIIGAESGPKRRPCEPEWVRDLVAQCDAAGVPVFVKPRKHGEKWPEDLQNRRAAPR